MASLDIIAQRNPVTIETINDNLNNNTPNLFLSPESVKYYSSKKSVSVAAESPSSSQTFGSSSRRKYRPARATVPLDVFLNLQKENNKPISIVDKLINKNKLALTLDNKMKQEKSKQTKLQASGGKGRGKGRATRKQSQRNDKKQVLNKVLVAKNIADNKKTPNDKTKPKGREPRKCKKEAEITKTPLENSSQDKQTPVLNKSKSPGVNKKIRNSTSISNVDNKFSPNKIINGDVLSSPAYLTRSCLDGTELRNGKRRRKCNENDEKCKPELKRRKLNNDVAITKTNTTVVRSRGKGKKSSIPINIKKEVVDAINDNTEPKQVEQDKPKRVRHAVSTTRKKKETQIKIKNLESELISNIPVVEIENCGENVEYLKTDILNETDNTDVYRHSIEGTSISLFQNNLSDCDTNLRNFYAKTNNKTPSIPSEDSIEEDIPTEKMVIPRRSRISDFNESVDKSDVSLDSTDHLDNTSEKESFLRSLGLQPVNENYTGTLKAVIKLHRSSSNEKGYRRMEMRLSNTQDNQPQSYSKRKYDVSDLANIPLTHLHSVMNSEYYSYKDNENGSSDNFVNLSCTEVNNDGRFSDFNMTIDSQLGDSLCKGVLSKEKSKSNSSLVVPEKSSSFSIHPNRLCYDVCKYCFGKFGSLDTPCHVAQLKNPERQKRILNSEPNLKLDTCLCDACYRHVDRKANRPSESRRKVISRYGQRFVKCAVESCGQTARKSVKRKLLLKLRKRVHDISFHMKRSNPRAMYGLCYQHYYMMDIYTACGICKKRLERNHMFEIGSEALILNTALNDDGIPVRLTASRLLCKVCHYYTSFRLKYPDSSHMPVSHRDYYENFKKKILCAYGLYPLCDNDDVKAEDTSERSEDDPNDIITIDTEDEREDTNSKVNSFKKGKKKQRRGNNDNCEDFSNITSFLKSREGSNDKNRDSGRKIEVRFGDLNIGKVGNLNIGQDTRTDLDQSMDIPLLADFKFETGNNWGQNKNLEKCVSTIIFDKTSKKLWHELQKPYGNQSSFLRHLIMLEKYWRSGALVLAENADPASVKYINSVQNRVQSLENTTYVNNNPNTSTISYKPKESVNLTNIDSIKNVLSTSLSNDKGFKNNSEAKIEKGFTNICNLSSTSKNGFQNICNLTTSENNEKCKPKSNKNLKDKNKCHTLYYDALSKTNTNFNVEKCTKNINGSSSETKMLYYDTSNLSSGSSGFKNIFDLPQYESARYNKQNNTKLLSTQKNESSNNTTCFKILNDKSSSKIMECKNSLPMRNGVSAHGTDLMRTSSNNDLSKNYPQINNNDLSRNSVSPDVDLLRNNVNLNGNSSNIDSSRNNFANKIDTYKNVLVSKINDSSKSSLFNDTLRIKISSKTTDVLKNQNNSSSNNIEISSKNSNDVTSRGMLILNEASSKNVQPQGKNSSSLKCPTYATSSNSPSPTSSSNNLTNSKYVIATTEPNRQSPPSSNLNNKFITVYPEPARPPQAKSEHRGAVPSLIKLSSIPQQFSILKTPSTFTLQTTSQTKPVLGKSILCTSQVTPSSLNKRQSQVKNFIPIKFQTKDMSQAMKIRTSSGQTIKSSATCTVTSVTQTISNGNSIFTKEMGDISIINKIPRTLSITSLDEYTSTKGPLAEETPSVSVFREKS